MPEILSSHSDETPSPAESPQPQSGTSSELVDKIDKLASIVDQLSMGQRNTQEQFGLFKESIASKLEATTKYQPAPVDDEVDLWSDFDPDSKRVVQSEIDAKVRELEAKFETKLTEREKEIEARRLQESKLKDTQTKYDTMASKEFPQLADKNHPLYKEFQRVFAEQLTIDDSYGNKPSAVYDSARIAYANLVNKGELMPDSFKDEAKRLINVGDSSMPSYKGSNVSKPDQLNRAQSLFASKLGVSPEKYIKNLRTYYADRDMS